MEKLRGAAIVGQSGGPTAAINATLAGVIKGALEEESITKLYGMRNGIDGFMKENTVDLSEIFAGSPEKLDRLASTPAAAPIDGLAKMFEETDIFRFRFNCPTNKRI